MIAGVEATASSIQGKGAASSPRGIVFSVEGGQVYVSWYDCDASVHLGPEDEVAPMMKDFLAQVELGKKFALGKQ